MYGNNTKISFIPKGSLVREESFLERRPRSVLGFLAIASFVLTASSYIGLSYYDNSLKKIIDEKSIELERIKNEFSNSPEVEEARVFNARAELARELLNSHTVLSPVFSFLSKNTIESIYYDNFIIKNEGGNAELSLFGEAPTYAALAYQADIFRKQEKELVSFSVSSVELTNFGTVKFSFKMVLVPEFLSYNMNFKESETLVSATSTPATVYFSPTIPASASASVEVDSNEASSSEEVLVNDEITSSATTSSSRVTAVVDMPTPKKQSAIMSLWLKFKFW